MPKILFYPTIKNTIMWNLWNVTGNLIGTMCFGQTRLRLSLFFGNKHSRCKANDEFEEKHLMLSVKYAGGFVMQWACLSSSSPGKLVNVHGIMKPNSHGPSRKPYFANLGQWLAKRGCTKSINCRNVNKIYLLMYIFFLLWKKVGWIFLFVSLWCFVIHKKKDLF